MRVIQDRAFADPGLQSDALAATGVRWMKRSLLVSAAAAGLAAALPAGAQTVLTVSSWVPPTHALSVAQKEWCDLVEKNASGKVRCNVLPRAVANPPGTYDAVKNGLADVSFTVHGYTP